MSQLSIKNTLTKVITLGTLTNIFGLFAIAPAQASEFLTFFGEDLNDSDTIPLASFPNASAAESEFLSLLTGVGTEDFESFTTGTSAPLDLIFPNISEDISATLSGGGGFIETVAPGTTNGSGRYATSGSNYFDVAAGGADSFTIDFDNPVAAFGFFGVDIGDFGGQIELELANGTTETVIVPNTIGSFGSTDGSVLFFGLIAEDESLIFDSVSFLTTEGGGDIFAFDDFTVGDFESITSPPAIDVPEPSVILSLLAISGLGFTMKGKKCV